MRNKCLCVVLLLIQVNWRLQVVVSLELTARVSLPPLTSRCCWKKVRRPALFAGRKHFIIVAIIITIIISSLLLLLRLLAIVAAGAATAVAVDAADRSFEGAIALRGMITIPSRVSLAQVFPQHSII